MPIHDWTRVNAGIFHDFHQGWTIEIRNALNRGILPPGYFAMADQKVNGPEPDVIALQIPQPTPSGGGGLAVVDHPPRLRQSAKGDIQRTVYARKANRISVQGPLGRVVAIIEIVSPGNKDSRNAIRSFTEKIVDFLAAGVHVLVVDLFPPTPRDPDGIHQAIWDLLVGEAFEPRPEGRPLTVAAYEAGLPVGAYVDPLALGEELTEAPLFLASGWYVNVPLEQTYLSSWEVTPQVIRDLIAPSA